MQIHSYQYTPIGYRSPLYEGSKGEPDADPIVSELWRVLLNDSKNDSASWEFKRKAINRVLDLFRYFPDWLTAQDENPKLTPHMRAFLEDTLSFINTGHRRMAIATRAHCMAVEQETFPRPKYRPGRHAPKLKNMLSVDGKDYMYKWLKHDNGFNDLLATANVIFGDITSLTGSQR